MTYEELQNIFIASHLLPWEHDYYWAFYSDTADVNQITADAYEKIEGLAMFYCHARANNAYIIVPKGTVIPEGFAENISLITDSPTEPPAESTETVVLSDQTPPPVADETAP